MKKKLLSLFFLIFSIVLCEEKININDTIEKDGTLYQKWRKIPFSGVVIEYDNWGKKLSEITYKNGIKDGEYILYTRDSIRESGIYKNRVKTIYMLYEKPYKKISTIILDKNKYLVEDYNDPKYNDTYYVIRKNYAHKISSKIFYLIYKSKSDKYMFIHDNFIWIFLPFLILIIMYKYKRKYKYFLSKKENLFIEYNLFFNTFENFNFLNSSNIVIKTSSTNINIPITTSIKEIFKKNFINTLSKEYFDDILFKNLKEKNEIIENVNHLINNGKINSLSHLCKILNDNYLHQDLKISTITIFIGISIFFTNLIIMFFSSAPILILCVMFLFIIYNLIINPIGKYTFSSYSKYENIINQIPIVFLKGIANASKLKLLPNNKLQDKQNNYFTGIIKIDTKSFQFKNGVLNDKQELLHTNGAKYITTNYKNNKNIGPMVVHNKNGKKLYTIYKNNNIYTIDINNKIYNESEVNNFLKSINFINYHKKNKVNLRKEKDKIFYNLFNNINIDTMILQKKLSTNNHITQYFFPIVFLASLTISVLLLLIFSKFYFTSIPISHF
ncbi:hypothetical protein [Fusobacterium sp. PH5-44]|uniref:hypothetical protein n=1 Tax=unclassified Fusobacterium TaxID=2648384 RepID=UPI003D2618A2